MNKNTVHGPQASEDLTESPSMLSQISSHIGGLGAKMHSALGSKPSSRRRTSRYAPGIEDLEGRIMMSATPCDVDNSVAAEVCILGAEDQYVMTSEVIASTTDPVFIQYSTPVYLLDGDGFIDVSSDTPLTIQGSTESFQADVAARLVMIVNKELAHRNQIQEGIIGQASHDGWGVIYQLHGNGEDERNVFQYPPLPDNAIIDMKLSYDGDKISLTLSTNGEVFAEETLQTVNGPTHVAPAITDGCWNNYNKTGWNSTEVSQGKMVKQVVQAAPEVSTDSPEISALKAEIEQRGADARGREVLSDTLSEEFTRLSGDVTIDDGDITFADRSFIVSDPQTQREAGEVRETQIRFTLHESADSTQFYLYNDTPEYNHETGHGAILLADRNENNIGVSIMSNGRTKSDSREDATLPFGEYLITMTDDDESHTTVITLPDGSEKTFTQPQLSWQNGGRNYFGGNRATIHSFEIARLGDETLGEKLVALEETVPATPAPTNTGISTSSAITELEAEIADRGANARDGEVLSNSLSEEFTRLSGDVTIDDGDITFADRSFIVSDPQTQRVAGEVRETRIHLTVRPSDDTHFYLYNDTEGYNHETGHGAILMPERDYENVGVSVINNGTPTSDSREDADLPYGEYRITMTDSDDTHTTVITLPDGSERVYTQPQLEWQHGGRNFINAGGTTIHSFEILRLEDETLGEKLAAMEEAEAINSVFSDPALIDSLLNNTSEIEAAITPEVPSSDVQSLSDTPEGRLQALDAKKASLQLQINDLVLERTDLETLMTRQEALLSEAAQLDGEAQSILEKFARQEDGELRRVTPSIGVEAERFNPELQLSYFDMPEGYSVELDGQIIAVPAGTGSIDVSDFPRPSGTVAYGLNVLNSEGQKVGYITEIYILNGKISRIGSVSHTERLPQISYIPELTAELRVTAEQKAEADQMETSAASNQKTANAELARLTSEHDALQDDINSIERQKIPYSRMHVQPGYSGDQPTFEVHYASNRAQTYFEVHLQGGGGYQRTIEHAGGEEDGMTSFNMRQILGNYHSGGRTVDIKMYADSSKDELLDVFTGGTYSTQHNRTSGETAGDWGDMETGRIIENPYTPTINISRMSGPNMVVSVQSPHDTSRVTLDGGGLFNQKVMQHEGGTELDSAHLTFNADNPEGNYSVRVYEGRNNKLVTSIGVHWNPATKELTMNGENPVMVATADTDAAFELQVMKRQLDTQSSIETIGINIESLRNVQQTHFYEASSFYIDADMAETYIDNSPLKGHPDANSIFHQALSGYEAALKETLNDAASVVVAAWNGQSQTDAIEVFDTNHGRVSLYRYLREFIIDFNVHFPTAEEVLEEGITLAYAQVDSLVENQSKELRMYKAQERIQAKEDKEKFLVGFHGKGDGETGDSIFVAPDGSVITVNSDGTLVGSEQVVEEHIQSTIADRVSARLNERLADMSIEERAEARGLLRLHQQGRLDEYLAGMFSGNTNEELEAELSNNTDYKIFYLLDRDILAGAGHAAMLMGSDDTGWLLVSFHKENILSDNGDIVFEYYTSLEEAKEEQNRYDDYISWKIENVSSFSGSLRTAISKMSDNYNLFQNNCDDVASDIIRSAGIELDDVWIPKNTFENNTDKGDDFGIWYYDKE